MVRRLLLLSPLVFTLELVLLIALGRVIGAGAIFWIVLGTAVLGVAAARHEGARVLRAWQLAAIRGRMPREGLTSSVLVLVAGVLLVMPGLLSDAVGLVLLVPPARRAIAAIVSARVKQRLVHAAVQQAFTFGPTTMGEREGPFIDVEATERAPDLDAAAAATDPRPHHRLPPDVAVVALRGERPATAPAVAP